MATTKSSGGGTRRPDRPTGARSERVAPVLAAGGRREARLPTGDTAARRPQLHAAVDPDLLRRGASVHVIARLERQSADHPAAPVQDMQLIMDHDHLRACRHWAQTRRPVTLTLVKHLPRASI